MNSFNPATDLLTIKDLTVNYGAQRILNCVNLTVKKGEIHALFGEHGAGKSTLIKVLSGVLPKSSGTIIFNNHVLERHSAGKAVKLGIETIYQEMVIFPNKTVLDNLFCNKQIRNSYLLLDRKKMRRKALEVLKEFSVDIDLDGPIINLNSTQQKIVEIARSICLSPKLLLMDEISAILPLEYLEKLHYILSLLSRNGTTIIYVSNNLDVIYKIASRVSIIKYGSILETESISDFDKIQLVELTYSSLYSRKELEQSNFDLFYLKNFHESILNSLPFPIMVTDTHGKAIIMNNQIVNLFKVTREDFINHSYNELLRLPDKVIHKIDNMIKTDQTIQLYNLTYESLNLSSGNIMYVIPFYDEDSSFIGMLFIFMNIKEKFSIENRLSKILTNTFNNKNIAKFAHEIKNPLGIILNYLQLIKVENSFEQIHNNTVKIEKEAKRINRILKNMLERTSEDREIKQDQSLGIIFDEITELLEPIINYKKINLEVKVNDNRQLKIDPDLLKQVVLNLLINGIEAMPHGGNLFVNYCNRLINNNAYTVLEFKDTGIGIEEKNINKIFEPFYSTKIDKNARGLGLTLSRDIIIAAGGYITVDSTPNDGSTFRVFIP